MGASGMPHCSPSPVSSPIKGEERFFTPSPLEGEGWGEGETRDAMGRPV